MKKVRSWFEDMGATLKIQRSPFQWVIMTRDLAIVRTVFINEDVKKFAKGKDYDILKPWLGEGILLSEGKISS
jgi:hypothetical protein